MRRNRSAQSSLSREFEANFIRYEKRFCSGGNVDWIAESQEMASAGFLNADGYPTSDDCCRLTWYRVRCKLNHPSVKRNLKRHTRTNNNGSTIPQAAFGSGNVIEEDNGDTVAAEELLEDDCVSEFRLARLK